MIEHIFSTGSDPSQTPNDDLASGSPSERLERVIAAQPWMQPDAIAEHARKIIFTNASLRVRYAQLEHLADRVNAAVAPLAACRNGCHYCCSMVTLIYRFEAVRLAEVSGRKMMEVPYRPDEQVINTNRMRPTQQCVFVVDGSCSVYEHRPMICRLHHSLANDAESCRPRPAGQPYTLMMYDPDHVEVPYHALVRATRPREPWGAITEFFPAQAG